MSCIEIVTAATRTALLDLDQVKQRLGIATPDQDQLLGWQIGEATAAVEAFLGRPLARQRYREHIGSDGSVEMMLGRMPIEGLDLSVSADGEDIHGATLFDIEAGIIYLAAGWGPRRSTRTSHGRFGDYPGPNTLPEYVVEYWAGYELPGMSEGGQALPAAIARAAWVTLEAIRAAEGRDPAVVEERAEDADQVGVIKYRPSSDVHAAAVPPEAVALLERYPRGG